jgi:prepilin-type N-terminal cleavage/methylation domain-containing protein
MTSSSVCNSSGLETIQGFTLVESLVAMAIFMLGFSGLYFFYNLSQHTIADSEKRMYVNLMADRIVQTIAAEAQRPTTDALNPFVNPNQYSGSLNACNYGATDNRQSWCLDLNTNVGPYNPTSGKEDRKVEMQNDGTGLIVNVSLIIANGNVSAFYTRKLRAL